MMRRGHRIAVEVLGPPLLAATFLAVIAMLGLREVGTLKLFPLFLVFGYLLAGLPSLAFAAIMELAFARGLDPCSPRSVLLSTALGAASGVPIDMLMAGKPTARPNALFFVMLGLLTGFVMGLLIRRWSRPASPRGPASTGAHPESHGAAPAERTDRVSTP